MKHSKISLSVLFSLRVFFYVSVALLLLLHPAVVIPFDRVGLLKWFFIIPFSSLVAFLPSPKGKSRNKLLVAFLPVAAFSLWAGGFSLGALPPFFAGVAAFTLTLALFHYPRLGKLSLLEPFFFAWVCFRLLVFSRAGEDVAGESTGLTQFILVWTAAVFLLHSVVVYLCLYPGSSGGIKREGTVFGFVSVAALALAVFILPADFVRNTVIDNLLPEQRERRSRPSDDDWGIPDSAGREGRRTLPGDEGGRPPGLRGLSEHNWPGRRGRGGDGGGASNQQFTVMVVASQYEPVYMADAVRGRLDPISGFVPFPDDLMGRLSTQRFFVTWFDNEPVFNRDRQSQEVFALSMFSQKFLPYRPLSIDPTILSENTGPFRYIHRNVSGVHVNDPLDLLGAPVRQELTLSERSRLSRYLEIPLESADRQIFDAHLANIKHRWEADRARIMGDLRNDYMETILAILLSFSEYQYNVNTNHYSSVADMIQFLTVTREGDCVEFSNTAALLGRLAGIPSRVVTGFLAAHGLQTPAHLRGLAALRSRIPILQEFPFDDLILVTDAHGHSWTQFYVPEFGWLDFEATAFAIPPTGLGDGNLRDVVIPLFDENRLFAPVRAFPWQPVLRTMLFLAFLSLVGAYVLRYGREFALGMSARRGGRAGARSLYLLLLARLAADGKPIKPVSKTAPEYARLFDGTEQDSAFTPFAELYSELRWRQFGDTAEMEKRFERLKDEYNRLLAENRRRGVLAGISRVFSLRALAYL